MEWKEQQTEDSGTDNVTTEETTMDELDKLKQKQNSGANLVKTIRFFSLVFSFSASWKNKSKSLLNVNCKQNITLVVTSVKCIRSKY